ncbi:hypothetical protein [Mesorhizobium sp. CA5]|uniref:hypothetical protein n=1 Tax=Mesorhizobium sp. CA5 TaxID=2876638 RepID=UPI001CD0AD77|nr:hypothetical protein [Mesorhizobium sp. CA5]MBZ9843988.1 hypothetical protein [Mesorhizobium sp. CA5]
MPQNQAFDRYAPAMSRSFALRSFNKYETEINQNFWSFKVISEFSRFTAKSAFDASPTTPTADAFHATGPDALRIPPTVGDWLDARTELENWLRLSALVSATAYLETYLRQIVRSALMAEPMCRYGSTREIDGLTLLKRDIEIPYKAEIDDITKGDWNARFAGFRRLFGPYEDKSISISDLEEIRRLRNDFAHGFGRDSNVSKEPSQGNIEPANRLSHSTFLRYMAMISKTAASIDRYILPHVIGNFELLHFYHGWQGRERNPEDAIYDKPRALQRSLTRDQSLTVSGKFCKGMMAYYDSV